MLAGAPYLSGVTDPGKLIALESELEVVRKEAQGSRSRLEELQDWVDKSEEEGVVLREEIETWQSRAKFAENDAHRLRSSLLALEAKLETRTAQKLEDELSASRTKAIELESQLEQEANELRRARAELNRVGDVQALERRAHEADAAVVSLSAHVAERDEALAQAAARIAALEARNNATHEELVALQKKEAAPVVVDTSAFDAQIEKLRDDVRRLEARGLDQDVELKKLREPSPERERLVAVQKQNELLNADRALQARKATDLQSRLDEAQRMIAEAAFGRDEMTKELAELRAALEKAKAPTDESEALRALEARFTEQRLHAAGLTRQLESAGKLIPFLEAEIEKLKAHVLDLQRRLGLSTDEADVARAMFEAAKKALAALRAELNPNEPPPPPDDALEVLADEDVVEEPMAAVEAMATQQTMQLVAATEVLVAEQAARELNVEDLSWLKAELEKLTHVRDALRDRVHAMLQRELARRSVLGKLLATLRMNEVTHAVRVGSLRRLQAAIELSQRTAAHVERVYFQKQIGSMERQLKKATRS